MAQAQIWNKTAATGRKEKQRIQIINIIFAYQSYSISYGYYNKARRKYGITCYLQPDRGSFCKHAGKRPVDKLHKSDTYIPELSLVAKTDKGEVAGYILLTKVEIVSESEVHTSLAVAPLAVLPEYQNRGIGGMLLKEAHKRAAALGYGTAVLLGHKDYYPRFGYRKAEDYGIKFPFDVPSEYCQVIELIPNALEGINGIVRYPAVFFE